MKVGYQNLFKFVGDAYLWQSRSVKVAGDGNDGNWHELEEVDGPDVEQQGDRAAEQHCEQSSAGRYLYELLEEEDAAAPEQTVRQHEQAFDDEEDDSAGVTQHASEEVGTYMTTSWLFVEVEWPAGISTSYFCAGAEANTGPNSVNVTSLAARTESSAITIDSQRKAAILRAMKNISINFTPHWASRLSERQWSEAINSMASITKQEQPDN